MVVVERDGSPALDAMVASSWDGVARSGEAAKGTTQQITKKIGGS